MHVWTRKAAGHYVSQDGITIQRHGRKWSLMGAGPAAGQIISTWPTLAAAQAGIQAESDHFFGKFEIGQTVWAGGERATVVTAEQTADGWAYTVDDGHETFPVTERHLSAVTPHGWTSAEAANLAERAAGHGMRVTAGLSDRPDMPVALVGASDGILRMDFRDVATALYWLDMHDNVAAEPASAPAELPATGRTGYRPHSRSRKDGRRAKRRMQRAARRRNR